MSKHTWPDVIVVSSVSIITITSPPNSDHTIHLSNTLLPQDEDEDSGAAAASPVRNPRTPSSRYQKEDIGAAAASRSKKPRRTYSSSEEDSVSAADSPRNTHSSQDGGAAAASPDKGQSHEYIRLVVPHALRPGQVISLVVVNDPAYQYFKEFQTTGGVYPSNLKVYYDTDPADISPHVAMRYAFAAVLSQDDPKMVLDYTQVAIHVVNMAHEGWSEYIRTAAEYLEQNRVDDAPESVPIIVLAPFVNKYAGYVQIVTKDEHGVGVERMLAPIDRCPEWLFDFLPYGGCESTPYADFVKDPFWEPKSDEQVHDIHRTALATVMFHQAYDEDKKDSLFAKMDKRWRRYLKKAIGFYNECKQVCEQKGVSWEDEEKVFTVPTIYLIPSMD